MIFNDYLYWQASIAAFLRITKYATHFPEVLMYGKPVSYAKLK